MSIIRAILNNGFFFIVLIVATTLYLAYSDSIKRDHGLLPEQTNIAENTLHNNVAEPTVSKVEIENHSDTNTNTETPSSADTNTDSVPVASSEATEALLPIETAETTPVEEEQATSTPETEASEVVTETAQPENTLANNSETQSTEMPADTVNQSQPASQSENAKASESVLTAELDSILDDSNSATNVAIFASQAEAVTAARQAASKQDYTTATKIYLDIAKKAPSANLVGELAYTLYKAGKTEWAAKAWLESAKMLVAEKRFNEAAMLSNRLMPIAPKASKEIQMNLQKIYQAHQENMQKKRAYMQSMMNKQNNSSSVMKPMSKMAPMQPMTQQKMPPMATMKPMPKMAPIQPMPQQNMPPMPAMKPMPNMAPMQPMPQQNMAPMQPTLQQRMLTMEEMQKQQQARYQAYLEYMRQQQAMAQQRQMPSNNNIQQ